MRWVTNGPARASHRPKDHTYVGLLPGAKITFTFEGVKAPQLIPCPCEMDLDEGEPRATVDYTVEQLREMGLSGYYDRGCLSSRQVSDPVSTLTEHEGGSS